ncbi:methyltransferase domain-containing protein [Pseudomonas sp. B35(2017)]|uniref:methyltransferase domain-containing protein n=1 Tax=Pseudomonas sp. B35(2017) TaxID=1981722 RepID=UPI001482B404|nr:methyltransferase domain-containing protein [Pseudomonas sp. B35(2017)]
MSAVMDERYSRKVALRHERLYGHGYQGPGSEAVFDRLAARLDLRQGLSVLDVGSGLGGDCLRLAEKFGVAVVGLDAAPDMTGICLERYRNSPIKGVTFTTGDVRTTALLEPASFDVVWTRDCGAFWSEQEKADIWGRLHQALRPDGQVLITDYCKGPAESTEFDNIMDAWGQHMMLPSRYIEILTAAGFTDIVLSDRTEDLLNSMLEGRELLLTQKELFMQDLSSAEYDNLLDRWNKKIGFARDGLLVWTVLAARRP